ncbi:MAG: hypothetical protein JNJ57_05165 [Saprospiraceae bacterium]|nr:hypothetical protein [Saprospiraceae bacterium]
MKKLFFSLLAISLFFACQNSNNSDAAKSAETQATEVASNALQITPELIQAASVKAQGNLDAASKLLKDAEASSAKATGAKKEALEGFASQMEGAVNKFETMTAGLKSAAENAPNAPTQTVLEDYIQSVDRYQKEIDMLKTDLEKIISGNNQ